MRRPCTEVQHTHIHRERSYHRAHGDAKTPENGQPDRPEHERHYHRPARGRPEDDRDSAPADGEVTVDVLEVLRVDRRREYARAREHGAERDPVQARRVCARDERRADLERRESERVHDVADDPVPAVRSELVVEQREEGEYGACVQGLCTIQGGEAKADGDDGPAEKTRLRDRDALRGDGAVALVLRVLVRVHALVRRVAVQDMEPDPEDDMRKMEGTRYRGGCNREGGLLVRMLLARSLMTGKVGRETHDGDNHCLYIRLGEEIKCVQEVREPVERMRPRRYVCEERGLWGFHGMRGWDVRSV